MGKRKSLEDEDCAIALALERVGEWWNILILRDALHGFTRFEDFRQDLGISPTVLTRKLQALTDAGLLERLPAPGRQGRFEYKLTSIGRDFSPVVLTLFAWGKRHFQDPADGTVLVDCETGLLAQPILIDRVSGKEIQSKDFRLVPGKNPRPQTLRRLSHNISARS